MPEAVQLDASQLDPLVEAVTTAFESGGRDLFLKLCRQQDGKTPVEIALDAPFARIVEDALLFLNTNARVPALLPHLLEARPADGPLRIAVGHISATALDAVPEERHQVEKAIAELLDGPAARMLRMSLSMSDDLLNTVKAYKQMHDALHVVQPLLPLLKQLAAARGSWPMIRSYFAPFRSQLRRIAEAARKLADVGAVYRLPWHADLESYLADLEGALGAGSENDVLDSVSLLASATGEGLNSVDVLMVQAAEAAAKPLQDALTIVGKIAQTPTGTGLDALAVAYTDFAEKMIVELTETIQEHSTWQSLDSDFEELQRIVVDGQAGASGNIDSLWRIVARKLDGLCGGPPPHAWAAGLAEVLEHARGDLKPPITPPVADPARDRVSDLIARGRGRFMDVDQGLLDRLQKTVEHRPRLAALLGGEGCRDG
jgi:hypothetical protein